MEHYLRDRHANSTPMRPKANVPALLDVRSQQPVAISLEKQNADHEAVAHTADAVVVRSPRQSLIHQLFLDLALLRLQNSPSPLNLQNSPSQFKSPSPFKLARHNSHLLNRGERKVNECWEEGIECKTYFAETFQVSLEPVPTINFPHLPASSFSHESPLPFPLPIDFFPLEGFEWVQPYAAV